jgi:hypothetical protein
MLGVLWLSVRKRHRRLKRNVRNHLRRQQGRERRRLLDLNLREEINISKVGEEDEVTCVESGVGSSEPHKLGPIDKWTRAIDPKATHAESFKHQKINQELWKQRTHEVQQYVARWMYTW